MSRRHMILDLGGQTDPGDRTGLPVRHPTPEDVDELADLMLDAYRGTTDADGSETLDDARVEVRGYFSGKSGDPMLEHSYLAVDGDRLASAVLVSRFDGIPLLAYAMTRSSDKGRGLAAALSRLALESLRRAGDRQIHLWVTAGNEAAERIYERLGFRDVDPSPPRPGG